MFQISLKVISQSQGQKEAGVLEVETTKLLDQQIIAWLNARGYAGASIKRTGIKAFEATIP